MRTSSISGLRIPYCRVARGFGAELYLLLEGRAALAGEQLASEHCMKRAKPANRLNEARG